MAFILVFIPVFAFAEESSDVPDLSKSPVSAETSEVLEAEPVITSGNLIVVMSVETGQVLLNTAEGKEVDPACSAKLMTAMLCYDMAGGLDNEVTVDGNALKNIGPAGDISAPMIGLRAGNKATVRQLLQATLISAANDACNALAYYCSGGDIASFVTKMNERAAEIGCTNTKYTNTTGLYDGEAHTTVEDVAKIAAAFYRYNTLLDISTQPTYTIGGSTIHTKNYLRSETLMKGLTIPESKGMIAGQRTAQSDYCLITAAESDGIGYVYVIMEAAGEVRNPDGTRSFPDENAYADMKKIFKWYKNSYGYVTLAKKGDVVGELAVDVAAGSVDHVNYIVEDTVERLMLKNMDGEKIKKEIKLKDERLTAPVSKNTLVGTMSIYYDGELLATVNLVTNAEVERSELLSIFGSIKTFLFGPTMKTVTKIIIGIIIAFVLFTVGAKIYYAVEKAKKELDKREAVRKTASAYNRQQKKPKKALGSADKPEDGSEDENKQN